MRRWWYKLLIVWQVVCLLAVAPPLGADDKAEFSYRKLGLHTQRGALQASFSYRDVFQPAIRQKLDSGLPTRILLHAGLERRGSQKPVRYFVQSAEIVYDIWDESYLVTIVTSEGSLAKRVSSAGEAIDAVGILLHKRLFAVEDLPRAL